MKKIKILLLFIVIISIIIIPRTLTQKIDVIDTDNSKKYKLTNELKIKNSLEQYDSLVWSEKIINLKQEEYTLKYKNKIYFSPTMSIKPSTLNILNIKSQNGIYLNKNDTVKLKFKGELIRNRCRIGYISSDTISETYLTQNKKVKIHIPESDYYKLYLLNMSSDIIDINSKDLQVQIIKEGEANE